MTPVGSTPKEVDGKSKPIMNSNVAIEMGFALGKLTSARVLAVLNSAFGDPDGLPFDIKHKRWPITYSLGPDVTKKEIDAEKAKLKLKFVQALKGFIGAKEAPAQPTFKEVQPKIGKAFYFKDGELLGHSKQLGGDMKMPFRKVLYLRIIPAKPLVRPLSEKVLASNVGKYGSFGGETGAFMVRNDWGIGVLEPAGNTTNVDSITQYFYTGEIWGINADIVRQGERGEEQWLISHSTEKAFAETLYHGLEFMRSVGIALPVKVIAGLTGVKDRRLVVSGATLGLYGRMTTDGVEHVAILHNDSLETQDKFLLAFFEKIFDQTGNQRPHKLCGFPPDR